VGGRIGYTDHADSPHLHQRRLHRGKIFWRRPGAPDRPPDFVDERINRHTYSGWFLGSGFEYNLGWIPGLFWRTEYRFASYDKDNLLVVSSPSGARTDLSVDSEKFVQNHPQ